MNYILIAGTRDIFSYFRGKKIGLLCNLFLPQSTSTHLPVPQLHTIHTKLLENLKFLYLLLIIHCDTYVRQNLGPVVTLNLPEKWSKEIKEGK